MPEVVRLVAPATATGSSVASAPSASSVSPAGTVPVVPSSMDVASPGRLAEAAAAS